jgi:hypothetical protein
MKSTDNAVELSPQTTTTKFDGVLVTIARVSLSSRSLGR